MPYAQRTRVPIDATRLEIEKLVSRHGADKFAVAVDTIAKRANLEFVITNRRIRFTLHLTECNTEQKTRAAWRSLLLAIRAKLESVRMGIESFDEAFLAHVVMRDGRTFGEITLPQLEYHE